MFRSKSMPLLTFTLGFLPQDSTRTGSVAGTLKLQQVRMVPITATIRTILFSSWSIPTANRHSSLPITLPIPTRQRMLQSGTSRIRSICTPSQLAG
nr:hypothetical protein [Tanacetum cinerariifolium]